MKFTFQELINSRRVRIIKKGVQGKGPVIYWMSRDQRVKDNWALLGASYYANVNQRPLIVVFSLVSSFLGATMRHYYFMIKGLEEVEKDLSTFNIPFYILTGEPDVTIPQIVSDNDITALFTDFDPLRIKRVWKEKILKLIKIPVFEVDAHNIVPCWVASDKEEYSAGTFRPKILKHLTGYLTDFPKPLANNSKLSFETIDWKKVKNILGLKNDVPPASWIKPGTVAGINQMYQFINDKINQYQTIKNDPNKNGSSDLSPYLHFGHLSAQRVAVEVSKRVVNNEVSGAFLEQLIVRKELSDNFCFYNREYDSFKGIKNWAAQTLNQHRNDEREFIYSPHEFENCRTHDLLWNAAQNELIIKGKMHGYLRMYWAKKILEWTPSPEEAYKISIYLNDKYSFDGRDPNGYTGIAWSIGGIHDRPWFERPVFGKIRFMNDHGCRRKFDVDKYISSINQIVSS